MESRRSTKGASGAPAVERRKRRGSVLLASLMVVVVVASLGVCMVRMHSAAARRQSLSIDRKRAFYVAEAGLSEAFLAVSQGKSGNIASAELPATFGDGFYWVEATDLGRGTVQLSSTGLCGTGRFSLSLVLRAQIDPVASRGVFARDLVVVESGSVIDGYDSRLGTYQEQAQASGDPSRTESGATVSCNGEIQLECDVPPGAPGQALPGMTLVFGDVRPGPGSSVVMDPGVLVSGSTAPSANEGTMPPIELPNLPSQGNLVHGGAVPLVLTMTETRYDLVRVRTGSVLRLQGPVRLIAGGFVLESGARLVIETSSGPVGLFCTRYLDFLENSALTDVSKQPLQVSFVVTGDRSFDHDGDGVDDPPVRIRSRGEFYGFFYAPRASVTLPATMRFFGALGAFRVRLAQGSRFTVDQALAQGQNGVSSLPRLIAWQIADLPDSPLVKTRIDPRGLLAASGLTPPPSASAYTDELVDIEYFDSAGSFRTYSGRESDFDWSAVNTALRVEWAHDD